MNDNKFKHICKLHHRLINEYVFSLKQIISILPIKSVIVVCLLPFCRSAILQPHPSIPLFCNFNRSIASRSIPHRRQSSDPTARSPPPRLEMRGRAPARPRATAAIHLPLCPASAMLATALASPVYACPRPAHHSPVLPPVVLAAEISSACEISSSRRPPTLILPSLAYGSTSSPRSPLRAVMPPHITPRHRPILPPAIPAADISPAREISSSWRPPTPNLPSLACGARPRDLLVLAAAALSTSMTQPQQRRMSAVSSWCGDAAAGDTARSRSTTLRRGLLPHGHQLQDHGGQGVQRHAWRSKLVAAMRLLVCRCADAPARRVARSVVVWPGQVCLCGLRAEPPSADETGVRYRGSELTAISNISKSITNRLAK
jgi:hypothetical protein